MGNTPTHQYATFIEGTQKDSYSKELVHIKMKDNPNNFVTVPYEGIDTLTKAFRRTVRRIPNRPFLGTRSEDKEQGRPYVWKTFAEVDEITENLARGFVALNCVPEIDGEGQKWRFMGIYAKNREEWLTTDIANMKNSVTSVAFYDTLGPAAVEFVIKQTKLTTISCSSNYLPSLIKLKKEGKAESIENLISFENADNEIKEQAKEVGLNIYNYQEVIEAGKKAKNVNLNEPTIESIYMFCYTSGTTGDPKAAMLSHGNFLAASTAAAEEALDVDENDIHISYLPLAHSLEKAIFCVCITKGCQIGFYSGDALKLLEDLQVLKPTLFASVPRLFNRIYDKILAGVKEKSKFQQWAFHRALTSKQYYLENNAAYTHKVYDLVFKNIRNLVGGRVKVMVTGSAPIAGEVLSFLKVCFGCPILEGYGQTETSAPATLTNANDKNAGHVGGPVACIKIRLRDIPEMSYLSTDEHPRGEICFKGPSVFKGYYKAPDKNEEAFDAEGWLRSGDVGIVYPNGSIKIIDRAKNIFKLSQGEYIAPEKLENVYIQSPYIAQIYVHGDSLQSYLIAIVVVDVPTVKKWARDNSVDDEDLSALLTNEQLIKTIMTDMNRLATENKFSGLEKIKQLHLLSDPFTIENDILTPTMKIKRNIAKAVFEKELQELYSRPFPSSQ